MLTKHCPSEILNLKFEMTVNLLQFSSLMVRYFYTRKDTMASFTQNVGCELKTTLLHIK